MIHFIAIILTGIACSLYMFPFSFTFLPVGNTKIYLAVCGLVLFFLNQIRNRQQVSSHFMVTVSLAAFVVSLICIVSLLYSETNDTTYAIYIIQMWVWTGGAYFVTRCMKSVHGNVTVELIAFYVVGVCAIQCFFALMNEFIPVFKGWVDTYVEQETANLNRLDRMYGIGASLDTGGSRFACALILLSHILMRYANKNNGRIILLAFLFIFIFITGNMVARTTLAGGIIAILYLLYCLREGINGSAQKVFLLFAAVLAVTIPILTSLYYSSVEVKDMFRFAFEAFFNLSEKGSIKTGSTNDLLLMWQQVPQELRTWIIGDGYFLSPHFTNPYYTGYLYGAYHMGTDVGYLRFIFYFGITGLLAFAYFFVLCTRECRKKYPAHKVLFILLLVMNYVLWIKVATDLFFIYALFLVADDSMAEEDECSTVRQVA